MPETEKGQSTLKNQLMKGGVDEKELKNIGNEAGTTGTDILGGYLNEDPNTKWKTLQSKIDIIEEMLTNDASIEAILEALKNPILSLKFYVKSGSELEKDKEIAQFVSDNIFHGMRRSWREFLREALTSYEYGFSVFEKIYKRRKDGKICWHDLAFREQKSIDKWGIDGKKWINGHPAGITQTVQTNDEQDGKRGLHNPIIPWNKLIIFTHKKKGNNFEGKSVLRSCYIHYYMKNLAYKLMGIAADRYGVGLPYIKHKSKSKKVIEKYKEMLSNIRSNQRAYAVIDSDVVDFDILVPKSSGNNAIFKDQIDHHDHKIYDAILASFLKLSSGDGGSNALSKDQSSFFLRGLQGNVEYLLETMNKHIRELVYVNFGEVDHYPTLCASDVGQISLDEYISSLATAKEKGLLAWHDSDSAKVREQLKLPELSKEQRESVKKKMVNPSKEKKELSEKVKLADQDKLNEVYKRYHQMVNMSASELEAWSKTEASKRASLDRGPIQRNLRLLRKKKAEWTNRDIADANRTISFISRMKKVAKGKPVNKDIPYSKRDISLRNWAFNPDKNSLSDSFKFALKRATDREKAFMKNVGDFDNYLESEYNNYVKIVESSERVLREKMKKLYQMADVTLLDGKRVLASTKKNKELEKKGLKMIEIIQEDLEKKMVNSPIQDRLFKNTKKMATKSLKENIKLLFDDEIEIDEGQFESFVHGHVSNVKGILFNEPRRMSERVVLNFGSQVRVDLAIKEAGEIKFNRNILKLSTVTHARGAYNTIQYNNNTSKGFNLFKPVVPKQKLKSVKPSGITASVLFRILSAAEITRIINQQLETTNTDPITGLNLHHNAFVYYYPVLSEDLEEEQEIAKSQREEFLKKN